MRHSMTRRILGGAALCAVTSGAYALDASVEGLEGPAAENVVTFLRAVDTQNISEERLDSEVRDRTQRALRAFGYYSPQIETAYPDGTFDADAVITIDPGPQTHITQLDVGIDGEAHDDSAFQRTLDQVALKEGDALRHDRYESAKSRFSTLALERGYFDAGFTQRRMEVRPWEASARIFLRMNSGPRYHFGDISFSGSQIEEARLRRMLPFENGDPYLAGQLAEYNQRLGETDWFRGIAVRPRIDSGGRGANSGQWWQEATGRRPPLTSGPGLAAVRQLHGQQRTDVPVDVDVIPADRHQFETGIGYATDVGPRVQFSWDMPWLNDRGHSLSNALYLSGPEQRFDGEYLMPLADPLRDSYRLGYGLRKLDNEDTQSLESSVELARRWKFDNDWVQELYFRTTYEDFTQADQDEQVLLLYPGISWTRTRTRQPNFPMWGDRQRLALEVSDPKWGSDARFLRTTFDSQWIRTLGQDNRFVGRVGGGAMATDTFDKIPPSLRFFAGGDQSVRGYSYESLSPENDDGELLGGQHMLTASAEYQRRVTGNWWGATFIDTGNAFNEWWPEELKTGAGIGVRWISPVGPVRFDIAHPFDNEEDAWRLHFAIGPEF
ncbi:autotransporter secretion outer membrane protein TamA [Chromohalobacter canadensis]|uniref:Translocation and assembly module subunit TamA n=1 Tax=Chromohalobacter canadensis TaxID=141389 RepID=A0A285VWW3_9GAMM|nr:autotransporter assembly complex family protein [Chromohalobacter canadensis]SOC57141.1 autotransporter secretion outer membrane protein TamA [Chromohalobacter canadensis]